MLIHATAFHCLHVNPRTNWTFVRVELADGSVGWGECSLNGWETLQSAFAATFLPSLIGRQIGSANDVAASCTIHLHSPGGLVAHSVKSAAEQALMDALARSRAESMSALLGTAPAAQARREAVRVYANINRATTPRTPEGFAESALRAVALGFRSVKLAPFDGVLPSNCEDPGTRALLDAGIARVQAVRAAVGPQVGVKVDCHWRFTPRIAREVLNSLADVQLDWFECPVSEHSRFHGDIRALRGQANAMGVRLAGAEMFTDVEGFRPFIEAGLYDTIMPDIKYCGGYLALLEIAELAASRGVQTAPHNPTGPICNFASLQACAVGAGCDLLEYQLGESPLYRAIVSDAHPAMHEGDFVVPGTTGLGAAIDMAQLASHPYAPVVDGLHPSLG
jgi:galactonate dehydratase